MMRLQQNNFIDYIQLAVRKGFEPLCRFRRTPFQGGRLDQLSHLTNYMAVCQGVEPCEPLS